MKTSSLCILFFSFLLLSTFAFTQKHALNFSQEGMASYYASKFEGRRTASGEPYRKNELTAAHRTLPFGTIVRIKNLKNEKEVEVPMIGDLIRENVSLMFRKKRLKS